MENREVPINPRTERIRRLKAVIDQGGRIDLNPESDPEYLERVRLANLGQTETAAPSNDNPWEPLPRSIDHDPASPAQHLPRIIHGKPVNQVVGTQPELTGKKTKRVMSRRGKGRIMKKPQPYERGRLGPTSATDRQEADEQRHEIRESMHERGEDV